VRHWVNANSLPLKTTRYKYRVALYWAFTTMTTVGYGDIAIVNNTERLVAMFAMIVGGACFGYIIGGVTSILENLDLSSKTHNEKMDAVKEYLYDRQYPPVLTAQIKRHFNNIFTTDGIFDMQDILEVLPATTANDLVYTCYNQLVYNTSFFQGAHCEFIVAVAPNLLPCNANDGEFLFFEGSVGTHLFVIGSGVVSILLTALDVNSVGNYDLTRLTTLSGELSGDASDNIRIPSPVGFCCGTFSAGQILGDVAILLTLINPFSAYVQHKAILYSIKKEVLLGALTGHDPFRTDLMQVASEARKQICNRRSRLNGSPCTMMGGANIEKNEESPFVATSGYVNAHRGFGSNSNNAAVLEISSLDFCCQHWIIHPELPAKVTWDALICFFIIYSIVAITYTICFEIIERPCSPPTNIWMGHCCVLKNSDL